MKRNLSQTFVNFLHPDPVFLDPVFLTYARRALQGRLKALAVDDPDTVLAEKLVNDLQSRGEKPK